MKDRSLAIALIIFALVGLPACTHISLGGKNPSAVSTQVGGGLLDQGKSSIPPVVGSWEVDYEFKGEAYVSEAVFEQKGTELSGQGADQTGLEWKVEAGQINGNKVSFNKVYVSADPPRPPVSYTGELKYLESKEYTGWMMEGTYSTQAADGKVLSGKWVSNPISVATAEAPTQPATSGGSVRPADISGRYDVSYQYNFTKILSKMWLRQDGEKLSGDGVDTTTGEKYLISKGWYAYPKITIVRQYQKAKGAKENRSMTFKAELSSNGSSIDMSGETQFGGQWEAHLVR
ncbi:MAG: hypothetical protein K2W82_00370 [Candidatus Obscuribacterales bacterium]|nr:hypothetical protein [Candidatus Obscuribacterales bacterium]